MVMYGDPAWVSERDGKFRFEVVAQGKGSWSCPPMAPLPYRVTAIEIITGAELEPLSSGPRVIGRKRDGGRGFVL